MKIILVFLVLIPLVGYASDITFHWLGSTTKQNSALSGSCVMQENERMKCNLRQISFTKKLSKKDADIQINNIESDLKKELKGITVKQWMEKGMPPCSELSNYKDKASDEEIFNKILALCKNPTEGTLVEFVKHSIYVDSNTCTVAEYDLGDYTFQKVGKAWVSNNGPTGDCGAITVMKLEQTSSHLWTYTQTRQYTSLESQLCKDLNSVNEVIGYSWQAPKPIKAGCEYIEFGI